MTKTDYFEFTKCTRHESWRSSFVDPSVWREYLWDFLVYPHERKNKYIKNYNKCLKTLPKLEYFAGPRIIFNSATSVKRRFVKLIYKLNHSINNPNARILIMEYVIIEQRPDTTWTNFTDIAYNLYDERL